MKRFGLQLIYGDFLARSVRGISCAPPASIRILSKQPLLILKMTMMRRQKWLIYTKTRWA